VSTAWILTPLAAIGLYLAVRSWRRRRRDRAWAARVARDVRDHAYLDRLEADFKAMDADPGWDPCGRPHPPLKTRSDEGGTA
jgi:hypothetical protein